MILDLETLSGATNHNGGAIHFGADGKLYVAVGDNANSANSQTLDNRLGKMLRINPDGSIPADNPFFTTATGVNRAIWALGLRNPFTFAVQPGTGRIFINDVGQNTWEEINDGIAGSNYGWPTTEGETTQPRVPEPALRLRPREQRHDGLRDHRRRVLQPAGRPVPGRVPRRLLLRRLCSGWIRRYDPSTDSVAPFATGISNPVDLKVGADGSLYYLSIGDGALFRVRYTAIPAAPSQLQVR